MSKENVANVLKGAAMGAANVVPGVSGGTIALITGIFTPIINSLNALMSLSVWRLLFKGEFKAFWRAVDGTFVLWLLVGIVASVFFLANLMEQLLEAFPIPTWAFFFGMIAASTVYMLLDVKSWRLPDILPLLTGAGLGLALSLLSPTETPDAWWFVFICGVLSVCTMILPGVSGSFILLILGKYDYIMSAVGRLDIPVLAVFFLGCCLGLLAFSKFLHWLLGRYERQTIILLTGFVGGSLLKVWPWHGVPAGTPVSELQLLPALIMAVAGVALVVILNLMSRRQL